MQPEIRAFWTWFRAHPGKWKKPREDFDEHKFEAIFDRLAELFPELSSDIEWTPGEGYRLVFSRVQIRDRESRPRAVQLIRALHESAPRSKVWTFSAFARPVGWLDARLPHLHFPGDSTIKVKRLRYEELCKHPLAIRVYVPRYSRKYHDDFVIAVERVLEAGMGEAWVLERLARLELANAKHAPRRARPIERLSRGHRQQ